MRAPLLDRRTTQLFELLSAVHGETGTGDPVELLNVSEGGLMIVTPVPMEAGETHEFSIEELPGVRCVFPATVVHVMRGTQQGTVSYYVGLQFLPARTDEQARAIRQLIALAATEPPRT